MEIKRGERSKTNRKTASRFVVIRTSGKTERALLVLLLVIGAAHYAGLINRWYWSVSWYDIPLHILGGLWIGLLFFYLFEARFQFVSPGRTLRDYVLLFFLVLGFVSFFGILWEFFEYFGDVFLLAKGRAAILQEGLKDTLGDFLSDLLGGFLALNAGFFSKRDDPR